jgi:phosphoglycerate dehydrogenase-like enzyme
MTHVLANEDAQMARMLAERLRQEAPDVALTLIAPDGTPRGAIADADVLFRFTMNNAALVATLQGAPRLRWVHTGSAGVDRFVGLVQQYAPEAVLTNSSGVMSQPIAEFAFAMICAAAKHLPTFLRAQDRHTWLRHSQAPTLRDLRGSRLLILGLGSIGQELARLAQGVGMEIFAVRRTSLAPGEAHPGIAQVAAQEDDWRAWLPTMDYVALCLPLTAATRAIIGAAELAALPAHAWLINVSRGAIIDETALVAALAEGRLGGAALDVTTTEPLSPESPLWALPNTIITPHISWQSPGDDQRTLDLFFENLRRFRANEPLLNVVPFDTGY